MKGQSVLHYFKCILGIDHPVTQTSYNEQLAMLKYTANAKLIAEIGVFEGFNTREFALNSPHFTTVYAIDPFFKGNLGVCYGKKIAINDWRKNKISKIKIIEGLSSEVAHLVPDELDFIFVDGDHNYEAVKKDFEIYRQKLSAKGTIAFHDARLFDKGWTSPDWGPVQAIDKLIRNNKNWKIVEEVDSIVFIQKA